MATRPQLLAERVNDVRQDLGLEGARQSSRRRRGERAPEAGAATRARTGTSTLA
jgi:hypothetical protein